MRLLSSETEGIFLRASERALVAVGQFRMSQLLEDFKLMAQNKNEKHEFNKNNPNFIMLMAGAFFWKDQGG